LIPGASLSVIFIIGTPHALLIIPAITLLASDPIILSAIIFVTDAHFTNGCALDNTLPTGFAGRRMIFIANEGASGENEP
jgi:hypothetical protein